MLILSHFENGHVTSLRILCKPELKHTCGYQVAGIDLDRILRRRPSYAQTPPFLYAVLRHFVSAILFLRAWGRRDSVYE